MEARSRGKIVGPLIRTVGYRMTTTWVIERACVAGNGVARKREKGNGSDLRVPRYASSTVRWAWSVGTGRAQIFCRTWFGHPDTISTAFDVRITNRNAEHYTTIRGRWRTRRAERAPDVRERRETRRYYYIKFNVFSVFTVRISGPRPIYYRAW